jgi:twitching motility protein PilT
MLKLSELLPLLDRDDVDQVVIQEASVPCTRFGDTLQPLLNRLIEARDIEALLDAAGLITHLERAEDTGVREVPFTVDDRAYQADILMKKEKLQLRIFLGRESEYEPIELDDVTALPPPVPGQGGVIEQAAKPSPPPTPVKGESPPSAPAKRESPPMSVPVMAESPKPQTWAVENEAPPSPKTVPKKPSAKSSPASKPLLRDKKALKALESILDECRRLKASDVHISAGYPAQVRRLGRITGMGPQLSPELVRKMLLSLVNHQQRKNLETLGYTDLPYQLPKAGRLRVNITRQRGGLKGCFRLVPSKPASLKALGLPGELSKITVHHQGLVVVSGPNGAGKTTTMASLVDLFNQSRPIHIITVEDPIEIIHAPKRAVISQREVGRHTRTFDTALKGALREDPDVIVIGELRDLETVEMALQAAETGHLVIATMSTPSGAVTIDRLIDMFPRGVQSQVRNTLAGTLKMVISQRLVPSKDGKRQFVATELITGSIPLYAMIRDNKLFQLPSLLQQGRAFGMIRIEDSLLNLVERGLVGLDVARANANDPNAIQEAKPSDGAPDSAAPKVGQKGTKIGLGDMGLKLEDK